jgi:CDP-diacylglycerol---serine O-phosphatidyltransferase
MISPAHAFHPRNVLTYIGLLLGCSAAAAGLLGHIAAAGALVSLAVIADTFDGRFARLFAARGIEPAIGVELDSLCDGCTFGMAPVVCTAALGMHTHAGALIWIAGFFYVTSALTRLAFYNVTHEVVPGFVGIPVPIAALIWASTLCFTSSANALASILLIAAVAMIAPLRIPRPVGTGLVLFALWPAAVAAGHIVGAL